MIDDDGWMLGEDVLCFMMIKGGGGYLTREKILFSCAKYRIIMVDLHKLQRGPIGSGFKKIPVEVFPFGLQ